MPAKALPLYIQTRKSKHQFSYLTLYSTYFLYPHGHNNKIVNFTLESTEHMEFPVVCMTSMAEHRAALTVSKFACK